jgi:beta-glucanase (GH16 family)
MPIDPNNLGATARLTFSDEFNGLSLWNGSSGTWSSNWWYNDEWGLYSTNKTATHPGSTDDQWYVNYNFAGTKSVVPWTVSNGVLTIEAAKTPPELAYLMDYKPYTSGLLNSWHSFSQQYGYFEISAKMPEGKGLWPAFWLLPQNGKWPPEIDVFEYLGHDVDTMYQSIHTQATGAHTSKTDTSNTGIDLTADFHRYGVNWQKDYITFYFDGQETAKFATPADMHTPMYMIVNMTVGGPWSGKPNAYTEFPAHLDVDYIRVYSDPSAPPPVAQDFAPPGRANGGKTLKGGDKSDNLVGEAGDDALHGAAGDDTLSGGEGADFIEAGDGHDRINGNQGSDSIYSGAGDDWALGGKDNDLIYGGVGDDIVHGNMGDDTCAGMDGNDIVRGGQGNDSIYAAGGNDWLAGDRGADTISGGAGADIFHSFDGAGLDRIVDFSRAEGDRILLPTGTSYSIDQVGADTVIHIGADTQVVLVGVSSASLTGDWLIMA